MQMKPRQWNYLSARLLPANVSGTTT